MAGSAAASAGSVLLVGNFIPPPASYGCVSQDLAAQLQQAGWKVVCTSYRARGFPKLIDMVRTCWRERFHFDVAHVEVYSGNALVWAEAVCALLRFLKKPYVLGLHGGNLPVFFRRWPRRGEHLLSSASKVVCPSRYLQQAMSHWRSDVQLLPNALSLGAYPARVRKSARPTLVWMRAFRSMYQPDLPVAVLERISREFQDARLVMAGPDRADGSKQRTYERARSLGLLERIEFIDGVPRQHIGAFLDRGDVFLNTSLIDNTPVSVMEALCCGLCVVSTNVGGIPLLLQNEVDALMVPPGDADAMSRSVARILSENGLAERLSQNALRKARGFDWSVILPQWIQLFSSLRTA